jgi:4a-hydroxytetrahydrobiopterin dehydratase
MNKLSHAEIEQRLSGLPDWSELGDSIQRTYQFPGFVESMRFVNRVAEAAEAAQHHPDILVRWNKVTLTLSTHDAGGLTGKDFDLARAVDGLVALPAAARTAEKSPAPRKKQ